jgi:hypothetical protein
LFESLVKSNQPVKKNEATSTRVNNLVKTKPKEKEPNVSISKNLQSQGPSKNSQPPKKNIFDENAFDIFDKSGKRSYLIIYIFLFIFYPHHLDNAENIFDTFSKPKNKESNTANNLFDF